MNNFFLFIFVQDISKYTKNADNYHNNKKTEDSAENEGCALLRDDDFNNNNNSNNYEEQSDDTKISNTSVAVSDSPSVATKELPSYSR